MPIYNAVLLQRTKEIALQRMPVEDAALVRRYLDHRFAIDSLSEFRMSKIAATLRIVREHLPCGFERAAQPDIIGFLRWLEGSHYAPWSRWTFRIILRSFLTWLGKDAKYIKSERRKIRRREEPVLSEQDALALIRAARHPRDRALVAVLWEAGGRIGEVGTLRIKDVVFEKLGTRLQFFGKTGHRPVLVIISTPYLLEWLSAHPGRDAPDAPLWIVLHGKTKGRQASYGSLATMLRRLAKKAGISKRVNPQWFRHSRATDTAKRWTEAQQKVYFGWTRDSTMPAWYSHLAARDADEAVLRDRGFTEQIEVERMRASLPCPRCRFENGVAEIMCMRCGGVLKLDDLEAARKAEEIRFLEMYKKLVKE